MRSESENALFADLSTEGRVVGPCWGKLRTRGPESGTAWEPIFKKILALFLARKCASTIFQGVMRYETKTNSQHTQNSVGLRCLNCKKIGESDRSDMFLNSKNGGTIQLVQR